MCPKKTLGVTIVKTEAFKHVLSFFAFVLISSWDGISSIIQRSNHRSFVLCWMMTLKVQISIRMGLFAVDCNINTSIIIYCIQGVQKR